MRYTITSHGNLNIQTITFPNISAGIYGFPKAPTAEIAIVTVQEFLQSSLVIKLTAATITLTR